MSDVMLLGILMMPYDMAMGGEISRHQYHSCGKEAAERIQADADELARLRAEVERLTAALSDERRHADALVANVMAAAACLDLLPATAIACGADEKAIELAKSAEDYAEIVDGLIAALATHRARRQG